MRPPRGQYNLRPRRLSGIGAGFACAQTDHSSDYLWSRCDMDPGNDTPKTPPWTLDTGQKEIAVHCAGHVHLRYLLDTAIDHLPTSFARDSSRAPPPPRAGGFRSALPGIHWYQGWFARIRSLVRILTRLLDPFAARVRMERRGAGCEASLMPDDVYSERRGVSEPRAGGGQRLIHRALWTLYDGEAMNGPRLITVVSLAHLRPSVPWHTLTVLRAALLDTSEAFAAQRWWRPRGARTQPRVLGVARTEEGDVSLESPRHLRRTAQSYLIPSGPRFPGPSLIPPSLGLRSRVGGVSLQLLVWIPCIHVRGAVDSISFECEWARGVHAPPGCGERAWRASSPAPSGVAGPPEADVNLRGVRTAWSPAPPYAVLSSPSAPTLRFVDTYTPESSLDTTSREWHPDGAPPTWSAGHAWIPMWRRVVNKPLGRWRAPCPQRRTPRPLDPDPGLETRSGGQDPPHTSSTREPSRGGWDRRCGPPTVGRLKTPNTFPPPAGGGFRRAPGSKSPGRSRGSAVYLYILDHQQWSAQR
ncbi:hypothetical protein DFH07DRAFT_776337 [Mycena maculata]|uniref:Uncharacterized protein n=1 Tax=Mycena maculata TaxID=230809 RepID=A0AAD7IM93_9AGAR|nr:hypothetical protein DFH07DRAFT_776337 [Mycena maculata]